MEPTIGRMVHYHSYGTPGGEYLPEPRAAIVTATHGVPATYVVETVTEHTTHISTYETVSLAVLNPTGLFFAQNIPHAANPTPGHWSWPPREEFISTPSLTSRSPADC